MLRTILVAISLIIFYSSAPCSSGELPDPAQKTRVLEIDAVDFIRAEAPSLKLKLLHLPDEGSKQQLIHSFIKTISMMYLYPEIDVLGKKEAEDLLNEEMRRLDTVDNWESSVPKLSKAQECVRDLYSKFELEGKEPYQADLWLRKLDIENRCGPTTIQCLKDDFQKHGVIILRSLVSVANPKLVIGCGNRVNTEPSRYYRANPHLGDDTIDPVLHRNPSIIGFFGGPSIFPDNHYQTILDEVSLRNINVGQWNEVERVLKPGGFYITEVYVQGDKLPKGSKLRLTSVFGNASPFGCPGVRRLQPLLPGDKVRSRYMEKFKTKDGPTRFCKTWTEWHIA